MQLLVSGAIAGREDLRGVTAVLCIVDGESGEVLHRCEVFAPGGGFVFNTIHNVQARTPVENVIAMLGAIAEYIGRVLEQVMGRPLFLVRDVVGEFGPRVERRHRRQGGR